MRTTIDLEDELLSRVKVVAARSHRTVSAVVNDAVRRSLAPSSDEIRRSRVELPVDGTGGLVPGVNLDDREALADRLGDNEWMPGRDARP